MHVKYKIAKVHGTNSPNLIAWAKNVQEQVYYFPLLEVKYYCRAVKLLFRNVC